MVLGTLIGLGLAIGGLAAAADRSGKKANPKLDNTKFDAHNAEHGIAGNHSTYSPQKIVDIAARCGVKPSRYGVLPENGWKHCLDYIANYANHPDDVTNFERDWLKTVGLQLQQKAQMLKDESEEHYQYAYNKYHFGGDKEKLDPNNKIVLELKHWHGLSKKEHLKRMTKLQNETILGDICVKDPILRHNPRFEDSHIEVWILKGFPWQKQGDRVTMNGKKTLYETCCKHLGYDPML